VARAMGAGLDLYGRRRDGSEFPIDVQLIPMEMNGKPVAVAAIRDVSERKRAEGVQARLATVIQASSAAIVITSIDGRIESWNRGAQQLYGYTAAETVGKSIQMLYPPERSDDFARILARLRRGVPVEDEQTVRLGKDGGSLDVSLSATLVGDEAAKTAAVVFIAANIRSRKELEERVARLVDQDRQVAGRELHDTLGQQITGIGMLVASLKRRLGNQPDVGDVMGNLESAVEQAREQTHSLIKGVFPVAVDAHGLRWALEELANETSQRYGVKCRLEAQEETVIGDNFTATQLLLIAREAVHNAVVHSGGNEVVIRLEGTDDDLGVSVRDNGRGIPLDVQESASMGLRIMRFRSGLVGGRLKIESLPGGGTLVACVRVARKK